MDEGNHAGLVNSLIDMFAKTSADTTEQMLKQPGPRSGCTRSFSAHDAGHERQSGSVRVSDVCEEIERICMYEKNRVSGKA